MVRVTNSVASHKRKKRIRKLAKGFVGDRRNHLRQTSDAVSRAMSYNYRHRKQRKSEFRGIWIARISAASKMNGISYSRFIQGLQKAGCDLNRKMLSELAIHDPNSFAVVAERAKAALA
jgi:large subunit ribosomal protein L20